MASRNRPWSLPKPKIPWSQLSDQQKRSLRSHGATPQTWNAWQRQTAQQATKIDLQTRIYRYRIRKAGDDEIKRALVARQILKDGNRNLIPELFKIEPYVQMDWISLLSPLRD